MTFQKIKEEVVDNQKWTTEKKLRRFSRNLALFVGLFGFMLGIFTFYVVNLAVTLFVVVFSVLLYAWIFDWCAESEVALRRWMVVSKFWAVWAVGVVVVLLVLRFMLFIK